MIKNYFLNNFKILREWTEEHWVRAYPSASRVDSSNYNPISSYTAIQRLWNSVCSWLRWTLNRTTTTSLRCATFSAVARTQQPATVSKAKKHARESMSKYLPSLVSWFPRWSTQQSSLRSKSRCNSWGAPTTCSKMRCTRRWTDTPKSSRETPTIQSSKTLRLCIWKSASRSSPSCCLRSPTAGEE